MREGEKRKEWRKGQWENRYPLAWQDPRPGSQHLVVTLTMTSSVFNVVKNVGELDKFENSILQLAKDF